MHRAEATIDTAKGEEEEDRISVATGNYVQRGGLLLEDGSHLLLMLSCNTTQE